MKDFFIYFFGIGSEVEFVNFSTAHFLPILAAVAVILLIHRFREPLRGWKNEKNKKFPVLSTGNFYFAEPAAPGMADRKTRKG